MTAASPASSAGPATAAAERPDVESFYHLRGIDLKDRACRGLACFVARHLDPQRWTQACSEAARVYCLGSCYSAPACGTDEPRPACHVDAREAVILGRLTAGGARSVDEYRRLGGYQALEAALKLPPDDVIGVVEASSLRGRGGAAFPTGRKWRAASQQPRTQKYVVANADEGDPGAYIDRFLMEDDPHSLIEGMTIAAYSVGASRGVVYVRCEYPRAERVLRTALAEAREAGFLGERICGSEDSFDIELCVGRGSYLCGEETALLNSIEGKRPVAMPRPPYATERGLFGLPTVINNVETLANVPWIVLHGAEAYHALGFSDSRGTKVMSLNSLFNRPGLYEVEFGVPVRRIVEELGGGLKGGRLKGVIIGGPLAGVIPPDLLDTPLGFEELRAIGAAVGHGGVIAFDEHTSIPELVHHVFSFGAYESCGKCIPCRLGTRRIEEIFNQAPSTGCLGADQQREFQEIVAALKLASLCGHGGGLAEFAESILRYYADDLAPRRRDKEVEPCPT